jgi:hypothetical protein
VLRLSAELTVSHKKHYASVKCGNLHIEEVRDSLPTGDFNYQLLYLYPVIPAAVLIYPLFLIHTEGDIGAFHDKIFEFAEGRACNR